MTIHDRARLEEPYFQVAINGQAVPEEMMKFVSEMEVEEAEGKASIARLTVIDKDRIWIEDKQIVKGSTMTVVGGHRTDFRYLFFGKISTIEGDFAEDGNATITINAIDRGYLAFKDKRKRSWKNKKISDILIQIIRECGFDPEVEDSKKVLKLVVQNEMNGDFIHKWAGKMRWNKFRTPSGKYYVGSKKEGKVAMEWIEYQQGGHEIRSFQPTISSQDEESVR